MHRIFRNSVIGVLWCGCVAQAGAMSRGPVPLDVKRIDGKPAACIPTSDEGQAEMRLGFIGVSRATGPVSPDVIYWQVEVSDNVPPSTLSVATALFMVSRFPGQRC